MSGAMGNWAEMDPEVEKAALAHLGLQPIIATQIIQRDIHADVMADLGVASAVMQQIAFTLWLMMQSARGELMEPRGEKQIGSSAMSHKRNPHKTERAYGLPRVIQVFTIPAFQNVVTPDFRAIEQSSVERVIWPLATSFTEYVAKELTAIVTGMTIFTKRMAKRVTHDSFGIWASQRVRNAIVAQRGSIGITPEDAELYVQRCAFMAIDKGVHFREILETTPLKDGINDTALLLLGDLDGYFNPDNHVQRGIQHVFGDDE